MLFAPALYFGLLLVAGRYFKIDTGVFSIRLFAILIGIEIIYFNYKSFFKIITSKIKLASKFERLKEWFFGGRATLVIIVLCLWLLSYDLQILNDVSYIFIILFFLFLYVWFISCLISMLAKVSVPSRLAMWLYSPKQGRSLMFLAFLIVGSRFLKALIPSLNQIPSTSSSHEVVPVETQILEKVTLFLATPIIYETYIKLLVVIGAASLLVRLMTFLSYWRLRQYRTSLFYKDESKVLQRIMKIVTNISGWPQIRKKAIKDLKLIDLPVNILEDLEQLINSEKDPELRRELERTTYELSIRMRDKDREVLVNKYRGVLDP